MIRLGDNYGPGTTIGYNREFIEIEQYRVFLPELMEGVLLSLVAVAVVVSLITVSFHLSLMVLVSVLLVDFYLVSLVYYWGMTINMFTGISIILSFGIAVDYSTHIAHCYLLTIPPANDPSCSTPRQIRHYKARKTISVMGSSVFHGAMSSILSLIPLS